MKKKILISSGGSGGHVIPATIFYEHLKNKFDVFFTVDKRGAKFLNLEKYKVTVIDTPKLIKLHKKIKNKNILNNNLDEKFTILNIKLIF